MKIGVRLFVSSMVFAVLIAGAYVWATRDIVGTLLLAMMAVAMIVITVYILVAERESHLASDDPQSRPDQLAGESMGVFTLESYWPICGAAATVLLLVGVVFLPGTSIFVALLGSAVLALTLRALVRGST